MSSPQFPEALHAHPVTPVDVIEGMLARLAARKLAWPRVGIADRIKLLQQITDLIVVNGDAWARALSQVKGIDAATPLHGEDWLGGPTTTLRNVRMLIEALKQGGAPKPGALTQRKNGQWVARVAPSNMLERMLFAGWTAEVWIENGRPPSQGHIYREPPGPGRVGLVLAAGNVSSIGPMDVLYKLFAENDVVIMKINPVNEAGGPFIEAVFKPLIDAGFLAIVYGGTETGKLLTDHPLVECIHMTGSDRTHDAIVWGATPDEQRANKAKNTPRLTKPISSELGCVTPVIVVPGDWSDDDLTFQARQVAGMVAQNASFNCIAAKVLVLAQGWPQRERFLKKVEEQLARTPARKAYYPGAADRHAAFVKQYPNARLLAQASGDKLPWALLLDVPARKGEYALSVEAFCGVLAVTSLDATEAGDFMRKATAFCNDSVWGTLSCMVLIDPATEARHADVVDAMIADLRYGGIAINCWAGALYGFCSTSWGAFPGHPLDNIESGRGVVHNTFLFDHPEKSVMRLPFRIFPTPVWFADHKTLDQVARALTRFEARPSLLTVPAVALPALKG